mgnify:CR=1 FL=1
MSRYGYRRKTTPNLDKLAKEGVHFNDHAANNGWALMDIGGIEFFGIYIQGKPVLTSYNIFNDAGGRNKAVTKTFICEVDKNQLNIRFVGVTEPQQEAAKIWR